MKPSYFLILLLVSVATCIPPVAAHSISFADVKTIEPMTVMIYEADGDYYGTYNTSSQGIVLDPNESYYLVLKAEGVDRFTLNPAGTLHDAIDFISHNATAFILLVIVIGLVILLVKR